MAEAVELIRKIDFFAPLEAKIIKNIAEVCVPREYSSGDYIIKQGETGLGLFFITSGKVKVEVEKNGSKTVVAELKEEDCIGELSIIDNKPRSASVICVEDTRCLLLTRDSFTKLMNKYPDISVQMVKALAERLRVTTEKMTEAGGPATPSAAAPQQQTTQPPPSQPTGAPESSTASASETKEQAKANGDSTKDQIKNFLVGTFSRFYTMKAMTRFSAAVIGCPVRISENDLDAGVAHTTIGDVKLIVFPASQERILQLNAFADGDVTAAVFRPVKNSHDDFVMDRCEGHLKGNQSIELYIPYEGNRAARFQNAR